MTADLECGVFEATNVVLPHKRDPRVWIDSLYRKRKGITRGNVVQVVRNVSLPTQIRTEPESLEGLGTRVTVDAVEFLGCKTRDDA